MGRKVQFATVEVKKDVLQLPYKGPVRYLRHTANRIAAIGDMGKETGSLEQN